MMTSADKNKERMNMRITRKFSVRKKIVSFCIVLTCEGAGEPVPLSIGLFQP